MNLSNLRDRPLKPMVIMTKAEVAAKWQHVHFGDFIIMVPIDIATGMFRLAHGAKVNLRALNTIRSLMGVRDPYRD